MREAFVKTLIDIASKNKNVHLITGDLGFGVLKPFWDDFPEQFTNAGVAEQNMTSFAAGMALEGKIVFTYSIGNFPTLRCLEQIRNDCAYHKANVKIVSVGGGFAYGSLGMSHHATEDIAIMRALPDVTILAPGDPLEAECATRAVYLHPGTCYLRLGRGGEKSIHTNVDNFQIGKAIKVITGNKVVIFTTGTICNEAIEAIKILNLDNIFPSLFTFPTVKPLDRSVILSCANSFDVIVTLEEHSIIGGLGGAVSENLAEIDNRKARLIRIGISDEYSSIVGSQEYLREVYGINSSKIVEIISKAVKQIAT